MIEMLNVSPEYLARVVNSARNPEEWHVMGLEKQPEDDRREITAVTTKALEDKCSNCYMEKQLVEAIKERDAVMTIIKEAMAVLENATCFGVGQEGHTIEEMQAVWDNGQTVEDDAYYDTCQHAWRILEEAIKGEI